MNLNQVTLPACDIQKSILFYEAMGFTKIVANDDYARFECSGGESTFSLEKTDIAPVAPGVVIYFEVVDLKVEVEKLESKGLKFESGPILQPWLWSEARLRDPSGNEICIYTAGINRKYPPWRTGR